MKIGGAPRARTHAGQDTLTHTPFSSFEAFSFSGWNDETVHGYVVQPANFHPNQKYPVAFLIPGGPHGSFGNAWGYTLCGVGFLGGDRGCALGGFYGGYMVAWIAGNWRQPWKCLVNHDGVFDIRLMSYSTDIPGFQQSQDDAPSWVKPGTE